MLVAQSCPNLFDPMDPTGSSVHENSLGNTAVGCHSLLQGIFPTRGLNPGLLHCRQILYALSHQGSYIHMVKCTISAFTVLCNHHYCLLTEYFNLSKKEILYLSSHSPFSPSLNACNH